LSKIIKIRIHQGLPTKIVKDQKLLKAICVFYGLKYLYTGGIILNISKRYKEISKKLEISETNLRSKVKYLIELGLITRENNNLTFTGFTKIKQILKLKTFKSFRVDYKTPKNLEILIKCLSIEENYKKQEYKLQQKVIKEELKRFGKIEAKNTQKKIIQKIRKGIGPLTEKYKQREPNFSINKDSLKKEMNPVTTLSRQGVAKLFNRKSKSTGTRFINKIKKHGYVIDDEKRIDLIYKKFNFNMFRSLELDSSYFIYKNNLYQRLPNKLTLTNIFA
jgi:DNA-binding Lrp family transcriptional regulator